jgi:hypothetical protein
MKCRTFTPQASLTATIAVLAAAGIASAAPSPNTQPAAQNSNAVLLDNTITGGIRPRLTGLNCQQEVLVPGAGQAGARNYGPAFLVADNFKPSASGSITSVSWSAAYRAGDGTTTNPFVNQPPPASETFQIRILSDNGPFQTPFPAGPLTPTAGLPNGTAGGVLFSTTVTNPSRTSTGQTIGTVTPLSVYEYTATIAGPAVTGGTCYWLEITNTSPDIVTPAPLGMVSFWLLGGGGGGQTGDLYSYQATAGNATTPYRPFDQVAEDRAFCVNLTLTDLISNSCPIASIPPICSNPETNGNGLANANGFAFLGTASHPNSVNGAAPNNPARSQYADNFQLDGSGSVAITSICFGGFWTNYTAGSFPAAAQPADLSRFEVFYYNNDSSAVFARPGTLIASFTGAAITVLAGTDIFSITHPALNINRGTCYWVAISYRDDFTNPNANSRFAWELAGAATPAPPQGSRDGKMSVRSVGGDGGVTPPGAWGDLSSATDGRFNHTFLLSAGNAILPTCAFTPPPPPAANDLCANATIVTGLGTFPFDNRGATATGNPAANSACVGAGNNYGLTVWFRWTAPCNGSITISTCAGNAGTDLVLPLWQFTGASCATLGATTFACGDDDCAEVGGPSAVTFTAVQGTEYIFAIGTWNGSAGVAGNFTISGPVGCGGPSTGACCLGVGCTVTTAAACTGAVGTTTNSFKGVGTVCNAPGTPPFTNNTTPCCRADFNQDNTRNPTDIFNFLTNYFNAAPAVKATTDTNGNGTQEPTDIFNYLTVFFAGGCG